MLKVIQYARGLRSYRMLSVHGKAVLFPTSFIFTPQCRFEREKGDIN